MADERITEQELALDAMNGIKVGDISGSITAIGNGAQVIYNNVERALTRVEVDEQADKYEYSRLAEAIQSYVSSLKSQVETAGQSQGSTNPYKALLAYDLEDAPLFYGRSDAIQDLLEHINRDHLTVLHSESGAGKTSLLRAGIMPRILANGNVPYYVRPHRTMVDYAIKRAILPQLERTPNLAVASLHDFLLQVTRLLGNRRIVILLDQFEEIFTLQQVDQRRNFVAEMGACIDDRHLPVSWVLALRGEWFTQIGTFRPYINNPFANEMILRALNYDEAREVIVEPARWHQVTYEENLIQRLIKDLGAEAVHPPQLQLVCYALFEGL